MKASQMNRSRRPHARDSENRSSDQRTMVKYRVQAGDTLGKIARKFYGDASRFSCIAAANSSANPDKLRVGQELLIPDPSASPDAVTTAPSLAVSIATAANPTAGLNEQRLSLLHPVLSIRARCMIALCAQAGIPVLVTQAFRTWEEQDALYAKGRTVQPQVATTSVSLPILGYLIRYRKLMRCAGSVNLTPCDSSSPGGILQGTAIAMLPSRAMPVGTFAPKQLQDKKP